MVCCLTLRGPASVPQLRLVRSLSHVTLEPGEHREALGQFCAQGRAVVEEAPGFFLLLKRMSLGTHRARLSTRVVNPPQAGPGKILGTSIP